MKQSVWFMNYEKEVQQLQKNDASKKTVLLIMIPVMLMLFGVMGMAGGASFGQMLPLFGMGVLVLVMAILLSRKAIKGDKAKGVRENLAEILTDDDQVDEFDAQMAKPLFIMKTSAIGEFFVLEDYMGVKTTFGGWPEYCFARRADIVKANRASMKNGQMTGKTYLIDLLDATGNKKLGVSLEGQQRLQEWCDAMTLYAPNTQL